MYADLAFINHAELTAAAAGRSCFSRGKGEMLVATAAALCTLRCSDGSASPLLAGVQGTAFLLRADKLQRGAVSPDLFPVLTQGFKAVPTWGLPPPLLPSGSLPSSSGFLASATKISSNILPRRCSGFFGVYPAQHEVFLSPALSAEQFVQRLAWLMLHKMWKCLFGLN